MPEKSFGIKQLSVIGSGTPQIQSVEQLNIRTGHDSVTGIGSTVVIGSKDSDFTSPAPSHVDTNNTTVLNVGVVTANLYYGTFEGTIGDDVTLDTADKANKINIQSSSSNAAHYLTFVDSTGTGFKDVYVNTGISYTPDVYDDDTNRGTLSITGNLSIGGTVTYEDVTNVDSLGIITARTGLHVLENGLDVRSGISTFQDAIETVSIGATVGNLYLKSGEGYCAAETFTVAYSTAGGGRYWCDDPEVGPVGSYKRPQQDDLISFTFSQIGYDTRTFVYKFQNNQNNPASGYVRLSTSSIDDFNKINTVSAGAWVFHKTAFDGGYSTKLDDDCFDYYDNNHATHRLKIEVGTVLSIKSAVGIGTSNPLDPQGTDRGAVLAVAGIVTAHEMYATKFYGPVEGALTPTGNVTIDGNLTVNGNTTLGNSATDDTIQATARFNTDLVPSTDDERSLGISGNEWKDLYIHGTANLDTVDIDGGTIDATTIGGNTAAVGSFTNLNASGTADLSAIKTNSISSKSVSSLDIGSEDIFMVRGEFTGTTDVGTNSRALYKVGTLTEITGSYIPYNGEILTFEFSEDDKETRTFQFKYHTDYTYDEQEGCSNNATDDDYGNATKFKFSNIAYGGWSDSDNIPDWIEGSLNYYSESSSSYRIKLIPKLRTSWSVGVGTTNPIQASNQGAILGVAGIVTAHSMFAEKITGTSIYGTFYGDVDSGASGTIENAKKVQITDNIPNPSVDAGTHYLHFGSDTSGFDGVEVDSEYLVYKNNKLGIGTDEPRARLHVYDSGGLINYTDARFRITKHAAPVDERHWDIAANLDGVLRIQGIDDSNDNVGHGAGGGDHFDFWRKGNGIREFRAVGAGNTWFTIFNTTEAIGGRSNLQGVGIGTTAPYEDVHPDNMVTLNVGVVTANEFRGGTFYGTIDSGATGTIENAKKIYIQDLSSDSGEAFQIPFASSMVMPGYKNLYFDTDNTLAYSPSKEQLSVQDLSLGGDLEVTGVSTHVGFSNFGDVSITGMSTHVGFSTFGDVSITGMSTFIGIATFRKFVGIGTDAIPDFQFDENKIGTGHTLAVAGIVTAHQYYGSGINLIGNAYGTRYFQSTTPTNPREGDIWYDTSTSGGGSSGNVTSVNLSSSGGTLTPSGGPITSSGTLNIDMPASGVTAASYTNANITVDTQGRVTAASNGSTLLNDESGILTSDFSFAYANNDSYTDVLSQSITKAANSKVLVMVKVNFAYNYMNETDDANSVSVHIKIRRKLNGTGDYTDIGQEIVATNEMLIMLSSTESGYSGGKYYYSFAGTDIVDNVSAANSYTYYITAKFIKAGNDTMDAPLIILKGSTLVLLEV